MTTRPNLNELTDAQFMSHAWEILTNQPECAGASKAALPLARRRFRRLGGKMFLALCEDPTDGHLWTRWGIVWPGQSLPADAPIIVTGTSLAHCAHKLGDGDAKRGWKIYWNHR